jgi:ketosteroid isomerase-like protein
MDPELAVKAANARFYKALEDYDREAMLTLWAHEPWVSCVHPGWEIRLGWRDVEESWLSIFSSSTRLKVKISDVNIRLAGECGWVTCTENLSTLAENAFVRSRVQATNVFTKMEGVWRMVHHHASPIPELRASSFPSTVH